MGAESALLRGRAAAEALMVDACSISRGGVSTFNPATGAYDPGAGTTVYSGKCRLQSGRTQAANPEAGGAVFTVERLELQLPFGTVFMVGDVAAYTASPLNPALVGNKYRVTGLGEKTHGTSQRLTVEVVS